MRQRIKIINYRPVHYWQFRFKAKLQRRILGIWFTDESALGNTPKAAEDNLHRKLQRYGPPLLKPIIKEYK